MKDCNGCKYESIRNFEKECETCSRLSRTLPDKYESAEPKVLSEADIFCKIMNMSHLSVSGNRQKISDMIQLIQNNGRLERDLELMEVTESVGSLANEWEQWQISDKYYGFIKPVVRALKNLKPLNKYE